jgi:molybdate transport system substrate-binding protein
MKSWKKLLFAASCVLFVLTEGCGIKEENTDSSFTAGNSLKESKNATDSKENVETVLTKDSGMKENASFESVNQSVEILVGAAASLQNSMEEIGELYQQENPKVTVTFTFGSSGTLKEQIEQGAPIDVFMSAAIKQMTDLEEKGLILENTKRVLLENKVVLIVPKDSTLNITGFGDILKASVIALGDPESVPAGQYAEEVLTYFNILDNVKKKASYGKDVTEILTWVSTGNADAGVVYATDAKLSQDVTVVFEAPEGSTSKVLYPVAVTKDSKEAEASKAFVDFLASDKAIKVFENYGFSAAK